MVVALGDQKEIMAQYLTELANGKQSLMAHIAQIIADRRTYVWDSPAVTEAKIRVVNSCAPNVIR